jgi:methylenetetrahydrofolate dehydrogenase (NADP+)/methenyltetrahydrofolate cyclohydrolase
VEEIARSGPGGARILDGAAAARHLCDRVRAESEALGGRPAALRVILLGNDAASETYVAAKTKAAREAGIRAETVRLPSGSSPEALLAEVEKANRDEGVDGILVQMPLEPGQRPFPGHRRNRPEEGRRRAAPENVGLLHQGRQVLLLLGPSTWPRTPRSSISGRGRSPWPTSRPSS